MGKNIPASILSSMNNRESHVGHHVKGICKGALGLSMMLAHDQVRSDSQLAGPLGRFHCSTVSTAHNRGADLSGPARLQTLLFGVVRNTGQLNEPDWGSQLLPPGRCLLSPSK